MLVLDELCFYIPFFLNGLRKIIVIFVQNQNSFIFEPANIKILCLCLGSNSTQQVPNSTAYDLRGPAKCTLESLVRFYAKRLAAKNVTVNCVIPGVVLTKGFLQKVVISNIFLCYEKNDHLKKSFSSNNCRE